ncbi:MAG: SIMPL domain-containing protein [Cytophagaceae bacterium]
MRSILLVLFLLPISRASFAQNEISKITTIGISNKKVQPDLAFLYMDFNEYNKDFNKAVLSLTVKNNQLEKAIVAAGFKKEDLKTTGYTVNKTVLYGQGNNPDTVFLARQSYVLEFPNDKQKIVALVKTISAQIKDISFNFSFGLSETKSKEVEAELIKASVADATSKAEIIATAAGIKLKRIYEIKYGNRREAPVYKQMMAETAMSDQEFRGFEVKDVEIEKEIVITWEINQP